MAFKFISSAMFVKDIQASRHFYEDVLGQKVDVDFGLSIGYVGGLSIWQGEHAYQTIFSAPIDDSSPLGAKNCELCFEADDLDQMLERVTQANVEFVHPMVEQPWKQRVFRIYDPDRHIIEIGEPMSVAIQRLFASGMPAEDVARWVGMPLDIVQAIIQQAAKA